MCYSQVKTYGDDTSSIYANANVNDRQNGSLARFFFKCGSTLAVIAHHMSLEYYVLQY